MYFKYMYSWVYTLDIVTCSFAVNILSEYFPMLLLCFFSCIQDVIIHHPIIEHGSISNFYILMVE